MGKEFGFEGLDSTEGVNLTGTYRLIEDLEAMKKKGMPIDKLTLKELREQMQILMDLQTSFGTTAPKEIGVALTKLRNFHTEALEAA